MKPSLIAITGPTASGKTGLSIALAQALQTEIVAMDSMQIYRGMDIGTAKPTLAEQQGIPHHMLDILSPNEPFSVAQYTIRAEECFKSIWAKGKVPILVGGTGLYLQALMNQMPLGGVIGDEDVRKKYHAIVNQTGDGKLVLHAMLEKVDPATAKRLHPNDVRRVVRAMEVYELTGEPFSKQHTEKQENPYNMCIIGMEIPREILYQGISSRTEQMVQSGLLAEVTHLIDQGVSPDAQSMQGIGYKELIAVVRGEQPLDEATRMVAINTRRYAKRQLTWFRKIEEMIWLDGLSENLLDQALARIKHANIV